MLVKTTISKVLTKNILLKLKLIDVKKIYYSYIAILLCLLMFTTNALRSQTTSFIYYGVEQGLSQSKVQAITQDDYGNLWIGTLSGLTKYNGHEFTTYSRK